MTTSEDLLVAKLRKWSFEEVDTAIVENPYITDDFFLNAGWTHEEYSTEWLLRRRSYDK